jgi:cytochrome c oxidase subunit 2|tara:strand:- start:74 stop:727 length:654 start_codon:yes stop_codon:yes gene_type:complete
MQMIKHLALLSLLILIADNILAQGRVRQGKVLFRQCILCHGENAQGDITLGAPALVNQDAWYLERQLANIAAGVRSEDPSDFFGKRMSPNAKALKGQQAREDVVAYIKSLPPTKTRGLIKGNAEKGHEYYQMICGACHGPNAMGNKILNAPRLVGINDLYLKRQYLNFKEGIRGAHVDDKFGAQMAFIAQKLQGKNIAADVAVYIHSLQAQAENENK